MLFRYYLLVSSNETPVLHETRNVSSFLKTVMRTN
jgi:hypothetical protein